jgi:hypothetical protein
MRWLLALVLLAGCGVPQSEECQRYVACQKAYDDSVDYSAFDANGSCWDTPRGAARCTEQCKVALKSLSEVPDPPKACRSD